MADHNHAQNVRDALDKIDDTPFGQVGKLLDRLTDDAQRAVNERDHLLGTLKQIRLWLATEGCAEPLLLADDALRAAGITGRGRMGRRPVAGEIIDADRSGLPAGQMPGLQCDRATRARRERRCVMSIPFEKIGSKPWRASEAERDRAAVILAGFLATLIEIDPDYFSEHIRHGLIERVNRVRRTQGLPPHIVKSKNSGIGEHHGTR